MRAISFLACLLIPALGLAQEGRPVSCRFLSFGSNDDSAAAIALSDKGSEVICPLSSSQLSERIVCFAKGGTIPFISQKDRKPMASATIQGGIRDALLIFVQLPKSANDSTQPDTWRIFVIDDSPKSFPDGGAYIANFYSNDIRFIVGEHKGMLHAAGAHGYSMPKERDDFNMAPVIFEFLQGDQWRIANESSLRFLPGMRYLIFAYVDPVSGRPRLNTYQDMAPPPAAPAAAAATR